MPEVENEPTAWWWNTNTDAKSLGQMLENNKGRLVNLDVFYSAGQQRLAGAWVLNTGFQGKTWWWNPNVSAPELGKMLENNKGRLVVLEPFATGNTVRFAAAWVHNEGEDGRAWWWNPDVDPETLGGMLEENEGRLTSLRSYVLAGRRRYAAVWIHNKGRDARAWWWHPNVNAEELAEMLSNNQGRLISLDPFVSGDTTRFAAAWVHNAGKAARIWWWYFGVDEKWLGKRFDRFCAYPVDLRSYAVGSKRYLACVVNAYTTKPDPAKATILNVSGSATLDAVTNNIAPMDQTMTVTLEIENLTDSPATVTDAELMLTQKGGWVESYFTRPLFGNGAPFAGQSTTIAPGAAYTASETYGWGLGATQFLARVKAKAGTKHHHSVHAFPSTRSGFTNPPPVSTQAPVRIGLWANPAEVTPVWVDDKQIRWLTLGGTIYNGSGKTVRLVGLHAVFEADGKRIVDEPLEMTFRHYAGDSFDAMPAAVDGEFNLNESLAYFVQGFDVSAAGNFKEGRVTVFANYKIGDRCGSAVCSMPALRPHPVTLEPPIRGRWRWGNSANHSGFDGHAWPHQRFSIDLVKVDSNNSSMDPSKDSKYNDSFYAYGEPVYAMRGGEVVKSWDQEEEHFGSSGPNPAAKDINYVLIEDTSGDLTGYYHLRKGQNTVAVGDVVEAGDQLGQVGNSGGSSEPHLHIGYTRIEESGRGTLVPMQFENLRAEGGEAVVGVPGNGVYETDMPMQESSRRIETRHRIRLEPRGRFGIRSVAGEPRNVMIQCSVPHAGKPT